MQIYVGKCRSANVGLTCSSSFGRERNDQNPSHPNQDPRGDSSPWSSPKIHPALNNILFEIHYIISCDRQISWSLALLNVTIMYFVLTLSW